MSTRPYYSLVMPAYNCENTIGSTIESLKSQKFLDFECIIVNDGSTDQTEMVIKKEIKNDDRFKTITIPNGGPGNARNQGINVAKGKYLYFLDSDDSLPSYTLDRYAEVLKREDPDLIISSYQLNVLDGKEVIDTKEVKVNHKNIVSHEEFLENLIPLMEDQLMYVIWNKVFKLDVIKENDIKFPSYNSCEDRLFNLQYFHHVDRCFLMEEILYYYSFDGKNSLTNKFFVNKFDTFEEFYLTLLDLTKSNLGVSSALFLKGTMSCIIPLHTEECPFTFKEKIGDIKRILGNENVQFASENSAVNSMMRKAMAFLFRSKSALLNYFASYFMYKVSQLSPKMIEKLKGNF